MIQPVSFGPSFNNKANPAHQPVTRFGNEKTSDGVKVGNIIASSGYQGVANHQHEGRVYPLMVGLRPAQEQLLQAIAQNTGAMKASIDNLAAALGDNLTAALGDKSL